jgi:NAD-dependent dihydropyrimidine dehydrogenase PreA subunit
LGNKVGAYNNNCISPYSCVHIAPENMLKIIEII